MKAGELGCVIVALFASCDALISLPPHTPRKGVWNEIQNLIHVICENPDLRIAVKDTGRTVLFTAAGCGIGLVYGPRGAVIGAVVGSVIGSNLRRGKPAQEVWDNMTQAEKDELCEAVYKVLLEIGYSFLDVPDELIAWVNEDEKRLNAVIDIVIISFSVGVELRGLG